MYSYKVEKPKILTDEGQRTFLKVRDRARELLGESGAFKLWAPLKGLTGDSWGLMANIDRLVELGEVREITGPDVAGQNRVFVSA